MHSGDTIYADGHILENYTAEEGRIWTNIVTPEVAKVAETLDEFRGRYRYNLLDENVLRFTAEVPQIWQWDDHDITNNWSDSKDLFADERDPQRAAFNDFDGFWEFVSGPLNAGSFGPNTLDGTFGPQVVFQMAPPPGQVNLSPYAGLQFFGEVNIDGRSGDMTVDLRDIDSASVFSRTLHARTG